MIQQHINILNEKLNTLNAEEIIRHVHEVFGTKILFSSSLGAEDQVITHMIATLKLPLRIITLDTGRQFSESYDLLQKTTARYNIPVEVFFPSHHKVEEMVNSHGINLFYDSVENRKLCCNVRKIEPLKRALQGMDAWITGLRREQSVTRTEMDYAEPDNLFGIIKINPLLGWTEKEVWDFVGEHKIPYNTLHDKGFRSIGCQPCTRAVMQDEDIRAGRWWWELPEMKECGLHKK
ncbi:MAG: phosphoadenylyl-sulfate reductase [Bacteroidales bacterium]|jgi:phosphoadenosine phosphosulfate reductase|nr:phosphoadenylyl-sulfate reductase [Bacteroidales bacterium]